MKLIINLLIIYISINKEINSCVAARVIVLGDNIYSNAPLAKRQVKLKTSKFNDYSIYLRIESYCYRHPLELTSKKFN